LVLRLTSNPLSLKLQVDLISTGVAFQPEITPFEPDLGNSSGGKRHSLAIIDYKSRFPVEAAFFFNDYKKLFQNCRLRSRVRRRRIDSV